MITTILVPLDGSELAQRAMPYAARLAGAAGARVVLLRAVLVPPMPGFGDWRAQKAAEAEARRELEDLAATLRASGVTVDVEVAEGDAAWAIRGAAQRLPADLVVMSTHGRGGLGRWFYGSVADRALELCTVPLMLVPGSCPSPRSTANGRLRVLVPLDGSAFAEDALLPAQRLAAALNAEVVLLHVIDPLGHPPDTLAWTPPSPTADAMAEELKRLKTNAREYLREVAARPVLAGAPTLQVVEFGEAPHLITAVARDYGAALVVMATHGRTGLARLAMGSVASTAVQHAVTPVVLVRPAALVTPQDETASAASGSNGQVKRRVALDVGPADRALLLEGLELLEAVSGRGSREATAAESLIARLESVEGSANGFR